MSESQKTTVPSKRNALAKLLDNLRSLLDNSVPVEDRRSCGRLECTYEVSFIGETGRSGTGEIINVSRSGLRLRSMGHLVKGRTLALNPPKAQGLDEFPPLMAKVVWTNKDTDGVVIGGLSLPKSLSDEFTWLEALLKSLGYSDDTTQKRKYIRAEAEFPAVWSSQGQDSQGVVLSNLGMGGALIKSTVEIPADTKVEIHIEHFQDLPALKVRGTVLRSSLGPNSMDIYHSCQFEPLSSEAEKVLKEYILKLLNS